MLIRFRNSVFLSTHLYSNLHFNLTSGNMCTFQIEIIYYKPWTNVTREVTRTRDRTIL